jgi:hypothetical protein
MYRACGYTEIPRYDDNVYAAYWFEKSLKRALEKPPLSPHPGITP